MDGDLPHARIAPPLIGTAWRNGAHRVSITCDGCGKSFERYASNVRPSRNFCSNACRFSNMAGDGNPKWRGGNVNRICNQCGQSFTVPRKELHHGRGRFCSQACARAFQGAHSSGEQSPKWKPPVPCLHCGEPFKRLVGTREKFCSKKCYGRHIAIYASRQQGLRAADRRRRLRELGAEGWHTEAEWEDLCRRARGRCAMCKKKRALTRDHIIPLVRGGTDYITNIQPLCRYCNSGKGAKRTLLL